MDEFLFPVVKKISTIELFLQKKGEKILKTRLFFVCLHYKQNLITVYVLVLKPGCTIELKMPFVYNCLC